MKDGLIDSKSDYTLTHLLSPWTRYSIMHGSDQSCSLEGNFGLWAQDNIWLSLYANTMLIQRPEIKSLNNKLHLRFHHEDNKIVSIGVQDWDVLLGNSPQVLSAWGLYGMNINGWRPYIGINAAVSLLDKKVDEHTYLIGINQIDWSASIKGGQTRIPAKLENMRTIPDHNVMNINVTYDARINNDLKLTADYNYSTHVKDIALPHKVQLVGEYRLDNSTFIKAKVSSDQSFIISITRNFRQLLNFCFVSKVIYIINIASICTIK